MNAKRDQNNVPTLIFALNTDGSTVIRAKVSAIHALLVSDGTSGTDHGPVNALRDENNVPVAMGVSSSDFKTPVTIYATSDGKLLTQST